MQLRCVYKERQQLPGLSKTYILTDHSLRTFAGKFSNMDFFLKILPLKDDELVTNNNSFQNYTNPDDHTIRTNELVMSEM